jgi:hypothetical protein
VKKGGKTFQPYIVISISIPDLIVGIPRDEKDL